MDAGPVDAAAAEEAWGAMISYSLATGVLAWVIFVVAVVHVFALLALSDRLCDGARPTAKAVIAGASAVVLLFALILAAVHGIATVIGGGGTVPPEPAKILHSAP